MNSTNQILSNFNEISPKYLNSKLSYIHMNIRSLRKNFTPLISHIHNITNKIHLIILTETNITDDETQLYNLHGYNSIFLNRDGRGGGIAVYIKEGIHFETITIKSTSFETIRVDITINNKNITVIAIYRPPCQNINTFVNELDQAISNINKKIETIIIGDMNIDIKKRSTITTKYLDMLSAYGLQCMVTETTREDVNNKTSTCIDHMFVRCNQSHAHAAVVATTISDHYALFGFIEEMDKTKNKTSIQGSENIILNNKKVNQLINEINWKNIIDQSCNTNELFNNIFKAFCDVYEKAEEYNTSIKRRNAYPWLSAVLLRCCKIRDKLHKRWLKNKNNELNNIIYKKFNNNLNKRISNAKNTYNMQQFIKYRNNLRVTWQIINNITGKQIKNVDETIKKNFPNEKLEDLTEEFAQKFKTNVENIIHKCNIETINYTTPQVQNSLYLEYTNEMEIFNILNNLNMKKSAGADGIRSMDLKNNAITLTPTITALVNSSLSESIVPNLLKTSLVRPIYKSGKKTEHNNYRPIAILSVVEKVLEEVIVRRLNHFLTKYNIIHENQFGFQKGKNINQLLGLFSNHINQCLGKNMNCLALFIDFSKAFDTLSHEKLINILERSGIRGQCIQWFKSYLSCRTYRVKIETVVSKDASTTHGVPQGSKLGPILYIIYANDLLNVLKKSNTFAYADDTAIVVSHESIDMAMQIMQNELNALTRWCHDRGLIINATKTKLMHIRPRHIPITNTKLTFHNTECIHRNSMSAIITTDTCSTQIELVDTYKYLGVHLDEHFKWKTHTNVLHTKLRKSAFALYHLSNCAPYNVLRQAYFSLSESYLRHGITAWGTATYCKSLQRAQDRILKLLYKSQHKTQKNPYTNNTQSNKNTNNVNKQLLSNSTELCKELKIMSIENIYKTTIINEFCNNTNLLQHLNHEQNTRRRTQGRFHIPSFRNNYGKNSLVVTLPTTLNQLPTNILRIRNKTNRKNILKKLLLNL